MVVLRLVPQKPRGVNHGVSHQVIGLARTLASKLNVSVALTNFDTKHRTCEACITCTDKSVVRTWQEEIIRLLASQNLTGRIQLIIS